MIDEELKIEVPDDDIYSGIGMFDLFDDGEKLWFTSIEYNALFKMDKLTWEMEYVGSFPNEEWSVYRLYASINKYEEKLFFTPCAAHEIGVYDTINKQFKKINIGLSKQDNAITDVKYGKKFISGFIYNETLILIPCCYDKMVFYDIANDKIHICDELFKYFHTKYRAFVTSSDSEFYFCWYAKRITDSEIVFDLHCNRNIVVIYNLATREFTEKEIGHKSRSFSLIEHNGKYIFLYDELEDILVKWETSTNEVMESRIAEILPEFLPCGLDHSFVNMIVFDDWLYLIPANANMAVKVSIVTMDMFIVNILSDECHVKSNEAAYLGVCRVFNEKLYLFANRSKTVVIYEEDKVLSMKTKISSNDYCNMQKTQMMNMIDNQKYLFDEKIFFLSDFLDMLINMKLKENVQGNINRKLVGSTIYDYIDNS